MRGRIFWIAFIVFIASVVRPSFAQRTGTTFAAGGPPGIYVALGIGLPNSSRPVNSGTAYLIERKASDESTWNEIATVSAPSSLAEFRSRLTQAMLKVPDPLSLNEIPVDTLWQIIQQYGVADSLKFWSGILVVRLAAGFMYLDTTAISNVNYQYRVSLIDQSRHAISTLLSNVESYPGIASIPKLHLISRTATEKAVALVWTSGPGKGASKIRAYRQEGLHGDFSFANTGRFFVFKHDSVFYIIQDTLVRQGLGYRYYLLPMDYYGNPGDPSDTALVGTYNFDQVPPPNNFSVTSDSSVVGLRISWRLPEPQLVRNLAIFRSVDYDSGYHKITDLASADTSYMDQTVEPQQRYFYYLVMQGPLGESSPRSAKVFGMYVSALVPQAPGIIGAVGIKNGVRMSLVATDALQKDFQVYRNDGYHRTLDLISGLVLRKDSITTFVDTSSVLSGKLTYAYAARAENASHVFSNFSDTVYARPKIPTHPPMPLGLTATIEGKNIQLYWEDMLPADGTIKGYDVFRRELEGKRETKFVKLDDSLLAASRNRFTDTTASEERRYEYAVQAIDVFGGESPTSMLARASIASVRPVPPAGIRASVSSAGITVSWDGTVQPNLHEYRVYRYQRRLKPTLISHVVPEENLEIVDKSAKKGNLYFYFVTAENIKGIESERSKEVSIRR